MCSLPGTSPTMSRAEHEGPGSKIDWMAAVTTSEHRGGAEDATDHQQDHRKGVPSFPATGSVPHGGRAAIRLGKSRNFSRAWRKNHHCVELCPSGQTCLKRIGIA